MRGVMVFGFGFAVCRERNGQMERMFACLKRGVLVFRAAHTQAQTGDGSVTTAVALQLVKERTMLFPFLVTLYVYLYPNLELS